MIHPQRTSRYADSNHSGYNPRGYHEAQWRDLQEDDPYYLASHTRRVSTKSYDSPRRLSFQRQDSYRDLDEANYHANNQYSRYPSGRHSTYDDEASDYRGSSDTMMEEEEEVTPQEAEALRNAELNKVVKAITSAATGSSSMDMTDERLNESKPNDPPCSNIPLSLKKPTPEKGLKRLTSFFRKHITTTTKNKKGRIQTMWVNATLGDLMDEQQQQEVWQRLDDPTTQARVVPNKDATKVAALDHIWVFRSTNEATIWTGFDYTNQLVLSQHVDDDQGIQVYDTHIRQGKLPILVIPKRHICYYASLDSSDTVASLQVACLPNSKNTQFVYRCGLDCGL